jgi:hypothetical protein
MNWTTKPVYDGSTPLKPTLTINEDGPLGEAGDFTIEPIVTTVKTEPFNFKAEWPLVKERTNKVPTHDPYTNPNSHIYYSCDCGNILDPGTKRFAELNNAAMDNGWKIRWGHEYYEPFCPNCVKLKGIE